MQFQIGDVRHPNRGGNSFCGPSAISIIHGCDTKQAAALLRSVSGSTRIKAVVDCFMLAALSQIGYDTVSIPVRTIRTPTGYALPTLNQWLETSKNLRGSDVYLIAAGNHYMVVQGNRICCGQLKVVTFIDEIRKYKKARMSTIIRVRRVSEVSIPAPIRPADPDQNTRREAKRLAAMHGIMLDWFEFERTTPPNMVYPPDGLYSNETDDPYYDNHSVSDWADTLKRVQTYVLALKL